MQIVLFLSYSKQIKFNFAQTAFIISLDGIFSLNNLSLIMEGIVVNERRGNKRVLNQSNWQRNVVKRSKDRGKLRLFIK